MKKIRFLIKLNEEGKLQITEPSDEISESYLKKSGSHSIALKEEMNEALAENEEDAK